MTRLENSPNGSLACHFAPLTRSVVRGPPQADRRSANCHRNCGPLGHLANLRLIIKKHSSILGDIYSASGLAMFGYLS